eukprot:6366384-Prymnesium_polylepis.1
MSAFVDHGLPDSESKPVPQSRLLARSKSNAIVVLLILNALAQPAAAGDNDDFVTSLYIQSSAAGRRLQSGCTDTCHYPTDGICDDGGDGSTYNVCPLGSDCTDCGVRVASPSSPPGAPQVQEIVVSGVCPSQAAYDGTYTLQGIAGNGAPYYKNAAGRWLYHDLDCGGTGTAARWILDDSVPDGSRSSDLDNDEQCTYAGRLNTASAQPPLGTHAWRLLCDGSWTNVALTLAISSPSPPPVPPMSPPPPLHPPPWMYQAVVVSGMCPSLAAYDGTYTLQGMAGNGAPYYRNADHRWLYHDLDCSGSGSHARWTLDTSFPDGSRSTDLDNDGTCSYGGAFVTAAAQPPMGTHTWRV